MIKKDARINEIKKKTQTRTVYNSMKYAKIKARMSSLKRAHMNKQKKSEIDCL
jgi:hypothetical protein